MSAPHSNDASSSMHHDESLSAPGPSSQQQQQQQQQDRPKRDVRFAISEDDAVDDYLDDEGEDAQDRDQLITRPDSGGQQHPKYPPTSGLPPSYREAVYKKDPWYKSEVALSLHHYGRACFSGIAALFSRYWPTSRFAQAGFFIAGLWVIVIVTGPTWDKSARLGWGKSVDDFLASIPPPPVSGDGHLTSLADWSIPSCRSIPNGRSTYCHRESVYKLPIPNTKDAFATSDKIFVFVDPYRKHQTQDRGAVPCNVRVKMDGTVKDEVVVRVKAKYEKEMEPLLERANVGMMKAGLVDQGVGIYTWPLPSRLAELSSGDPDTFPYPLLSFDIYVHVEPHSRIPNFLLEGAHMDVGFFTDVEPSSTLAPRSDSLVTQPMQLSNATKAKLAHARLGHAIGVAKEERRKEREEKKRQSQVASPETDPHTFFGGVAVNVVKGNIAIADKIRAHGQLLLSNNQGSIDVRPSSTIKGTELILKSQQGNISVGHDASLEALDTLQLVSKNGSVVGETNVQIKGTRVTGEAHLGGIDGARGMQWTSNHTLFLTARDDVVALAGIEPPFRPALGKGTEQHAWVSVDATSERGRVDVTFKEHVRGTPLRGKFTSQSDSLEVEDLAVNVALHPEYSGSFELRGGASTAAQDVIAPQTPAAADPDRTRTRIYESKDQSGIGKTGEVWWRDDHGVAGNGKPTGQDWGSVQLSAAKKGRVRLSFDAV